MSTPDDLKNAAGFMHLGQYGFGIRDAAHVQRALKEAVERIQAEQNVDPEEAMERLAGALGEMRSDDFRFIMRVPGDIGTTEPDDLVIRFDAEEGAATDFGQAQAEPGSGLAGDWGTTEPDD